MSRIPNLFLAGFQKCATSSLFRSLTAHPEIAGPTRVTGIGSELCPKEVHYFNLKFAEDLSEYASYYNGADTKYLLDGTPNYLCSSKAMERLVSTIENPLFLVSLRNPILRIFSAWNHWLQLSELERWPIPCPTGTLIDNVKAELEVIDMQDPKEGFLSIGLYAIHISRAINLIGRERFHFTFVEWLEVDYQKEMQRMFHFLDLPSYVVPSYREHVRPYEKNIQDEELVLMLRDFYCGEADRLFNLIGIRPHW